MNTLERIVAKNVILKYRNTPNFSSEQDLISCIGSFEKLADFLEFLVVKKNVPLACLPISYIKNKKFIVKLLNKKQSLINELFLLDQNYYQDIIQEINLKKFIKRCKFALNPVIKRDINYIIGNQQQIEVSDILPTSTQQLETKKV